jgi:hypothetical protein
MAPSTRIDDKRLAGLLWNQQDVITREQALDAVLTKHALEHRLRPGGPWRRLLPGVYLTVTGRPSQVQLEMAALLYGGRDSVITGPVALSYNRIRGPQSKVIDLLVPFTCRRQDAEFVRLHRTRRMPERPEVFGRIRYTQATRAVGDTVRGLSDLRDVRDVIADAVQRDRCKIQDLAAELAAGAIRESRLFREALREVTDGIRSVAEGDLRALLLKSGLPMPMFNPELYAGEEFIARPDAWYPELGIAIEVDSTEWHLKARDHQNDVQRQTRMGKHLIVVLRFKPWEIRHEPERVIREIRDAIERAHGRPRLDLLVIPAA